MDGPLISSLTEPSLRRVTAEWFAKFVRRHRETDDHPTLEIVRLAAEERADMIVMGTQGRTGLDRLLLGSVAERVIRRAPCPVLTVRPDTDEQESA